MIFSVVAVQWGLPAGEFWQHLIRLLAATIVGIAVYGSAVSLMRRPLAKEVWEVMGWVLQTEAHCWTLSSRSAGSLRLLETQACVA